MSDEDSDEQSSEEIPKQMIDAEIQVLDDSKNAIAELSKKISCIGEQLYASKFRFANICEDDKVLFYTGFPNYTTLKACSNYVLGTLLINLSEITPQACI